MKHSIPGTVFSVFFSTLLGVCLGTTTKDFVELGFKVMPDDHLRRRSMSPRTLIVVGSPEWKVQHKNFIQTLELDGHQLTYHNYYDMSHSVPSLAQFNSPLYDNVILASLSLDSENKNVKLSQNCKEFLEEFSGNILVLGVSPKLFPIPFFSFLHIAMFSSQHVKDYFSNIEKDPHKVFTKVVPLSPSVLSADLLEEGVMFQGPALIVNKVNALQFPFLQHESTTLVDTKPNLTPSKVTSSLVTAFQSRDNARLVMTASFPLCRDSSVRLHPPNAKFCREMAEWTFKQRGVIDWSNLVHESKMTHQTKSAYVVKEPIKLSLRLHQLETTFKNSLNRNVSAQWVPVDKDVGHHLQVEYRMLNPYWRLYFDSQEDFDQGTEFTVSLRCPDQHGVYKFVVLFVKKGYTFLKLETITQVRTPFHDDYVRFPWIAAPYYASCVASLAFVLLVSIVLLHGKLA